MDKQSGLSEKLERIQALFDIEMLLSREAANPKNIANYYAVNRLAYFLFHNTAGFVHMGMSIDAQVRKEDLLEQAKIVSRYQKEHGKTLELALGKGANSAYLANRFPRAVFHGIDLEGGQSATAIKLAKKLPNFFPVSGDYHDLSRYSANQFDCVFVIEALCHSVNKQRVFDEVKRVLKPEGYFVIIDGYAARPESELSSEELLAKQLTEKGMMVEKFEEYSRVRDFLLSAGFKLIYEENATKKVLPSLRRMEKRKITRWFFGMPLLGKLIRSVFPEEFTGNAVSGYLLATLSGDRNVFQYWVTVLQKEV